MLENIDALIEQTFQRLEEIKERWQTQQRELEENEKELKFDDSSLRVGGNGTGTFSETVDETPSRRNDDYDDNWKQSNAVGKIRPGKWAVHCQED